MRFTHWSEEDSKQRALLNLIINDIKSVIIFLMKTFLKKFGACVF